MVAPEDVAFLICVEANALEPQAALLCESLRTFGGRYRHAPILAISPRPGLALGPEARARLELLGVSWVAEPLNETGRSYGTINRVVAGAWAEAVSPRPYLALLDTDMIFVGEPAFPRAGVSVRPVDVKGSASSGPSDPQDAYWQRLCALGGLDLSCLPWIETTVDHVPIRASYNGGLTVVRRELGILEATRRIFFAALAENLRPLPGAGFNVLASTGPVGFEASEWWGSSQAALSVAIWSKTRDLHLLDSRYNIPLHLLADFGRSWPLPEGTEPILLHYHFLAGPAYRESLRQALGNAGCSEEIQGWIFDRVSRFESIYYEARPPRPELTRETR